MYFSKKTLFLSLVLLLLFFATFVFIFLSNTKEIATSKNEAFLEEVRTVSENFYLLEKQRGEELLEQVAATRVIQDAKKEKNLRRYLRFLLEGNNITGAKIETKNGALVKTLGNPGVIQKELPSRSGRRVIIESISPTLFLTELRSLTGKEFSLWNNNQLLASTLPGKPLPQKGKEVNLNKKKYRLDQILLAQNTLSIALEEDGFSWSFPQLSLLLLASLLILFLLLQVLVRKNSKKQIALILEATRKMTRGDFKSEIPKTSSREINLLAKEMGRMGSEISSLIQSLQGAKEKLEDTIKKSAQALALGPNEKEAFLLLLDLAMQVTESDGGMIENKKRGEKYSDSLTEKTLAQDLLNNLSDGKPLEKNVNGHYYIALPLFSFQEITGGLVLEKSSPFLENDQESLQYLISQAQIALENNDLHARLKKEASTDDLTGLANRREARKSLERERERSLRFQRSFSIMIIDVDDFKKINDQYGHNQGDIILEDIAQTLTKSMRHIDLVARWGGEEFLVLLPETDQEHARQAAERLQRVARGSLPVTLSIGIASYPQNSENIDDLLLLADNAMYSAKDSGKDSVAISE